MIKLISNLWKPKAKENAIAAKITIKEIPAGTWWKK